MLIIRIFLVAILFQDVLAMEEPLPDWLKVYQQNSTKNNLEGLNFPSESESELATVSELDEFINTEKSEEEQLEVRIERIEEAVSERIGKLTSEQKQIVATYCTQFISTGDEWLTYRRVIQNAARKLFVTRKFNDNFEAELIDLMRNPDRYKSDIYMQSSAHNMTVSATLIAELFTTLTDKQRETLIENIDDLIDTVESFQS